MRLTLGSYVLGSTVIAATVVAHTIMTREQYYPVAVNLVANKGKLMALGNMGFVFAILFAKLMIKLFLGTLREEEWENLNDRVSSTFIDTLLAMTIFRGDFGASFIVLFVLLLSSKIFHWTVQDRVDYIERTPLLSRLTYLRVFTFIFLLAVFDLLFVFYAGTITKTRGASIMLLFGFEYAVLFALSLQSMAKFFLNLEDMRREGRWDQKGAYVLYIDFATDMFKLVVYFMFFSFVMMYYGMPFHLIRQMYMTFRSFQRKVKELMQYRRATANMNQRFPDATAEEIANAHGVCIVCREEMIAAKKLPCSHVLHFHCLRSWLERSQTCPMCTASVLEERPQQQRQQPAQQQPQLQAQQQQQAQQPPAHAHQYHQQPQAHQRPIRPSSFTLPFIPPAAQGAQQTTGSQPSTLPAQADPNLNLPEGFENMMYESPLVHVARIQQHLEYLQLETQLLWQTIFIQQQMFMQQMAGTLPQFNGNNNNDQNNNQNNFVPPGFLPNMNTNADTNNINISSNTTTSNNTNNTNNSDTNTTTTTTNTIPRINSDDELLREVMKESARTQTITSSPPRTTTTSFSTSLPSSPSSTSAPSLPTSPSTSSTPTSPSPDDEDKDSLRRRRLMKFSASNE